MPTLQEPLNHLPHPLVSADWLLEHLDNPQVAIADCRFSLADPTLGQTLYNTAHIPGAYYFDLNHDLSGPVGQHGGRHPLPDPTVLANKLAALGINFPHSTSSELSSKLIVAYDDSRFAFAARFWWLLNYLGYERVAVLNGGFESWQEAGYPVTSDIPNPQVGHFVPQVRSDWVVDRDLVKTRKDLPTIALVDSREGDRYRGEQEPIDPVAGHIPGAVNYPWQDVTDEQGYGRSIDEQRQRWAALQNAEEILVYCGSGVTACVNLLSLSIAGITTGKLYAGSWSDWCSYCED